MRTIIPVVLSCSLDVRGISYCKYADSDFSTSGGEIESCVHESSH